MSKRRARRTRGRLAARATPSARVHSPAEPIRTGAPSQSSIGAPSRTATDKLAPPPRSRLVWRDVFGTTFWVMAGGTLAAGIACWAFKGPEVVRQSFASDVDLLLFLAPRFGAGMLIAAFVQKLIHREQIARYVSEGAGVKAIGIATVVGGLTPGGPMTSFPLVRMLRDVGTGRSALVAYVTSWSTMGFQRILNWELPLLGPEFTLLRLASSLPLPIIAGLTARLLPADDPSAAPPTREAASDAR